MASGEMTEDELMNNRDVGANVDDLELSPLHEFHPFFSRIKKEKKGQIRADGIAMKEGKFRKAEDVQIRHNFFQFIRRHRKELQDICQDIEGSIPLMLLGYFRKSPRYAVEYKQVRQLLKEDKYALRLGQKLGDRTLHSIYHRARKLFCPLTKLSALTDNDREEIIELYKRKGPSWVDIALNAKSSPTDAAVQELIRLQTKKGKANVKKGIWSAKESKKLLEAVSDATNGDIRNWRDHNVSWVNVAKNVRRRTATNCRLHFTRKLVLRLDHPELDTRKKLQWNDEDIAKFIYFIAEEKYRSEDEMDWDTIKEKFKYVGPLGALIRQWWELKALVQHDKIKYKRLINWLTIHHLPKVMESAGISTEVLENFMCD